MNVLHINTFDFAGGAGDLVNDLVHSLEGQQNLLVKQKYTVSSKIMEFAKSPKDNFFFLLDSFIWKLKIRKTFKGILSITEEFNDTYKKLKKSEIYKNADIVHLHNIHGSFFDLDALVDIAKEKPIVWSLHDMWAMTGGEAFTYGNRNYVVGIGKTPYKKNYPLYSPLIDRRQYYIEKKKKIYNTISSKVIFVPACDWLENCLRESYVYNPQMQIKRIYYGVNQEIFLNKKLRNWKIPRILIVNSGNPFKGEAIYNIVFGKLKKNLRYELYIIGKKLDVDFDYPVKFFNYINNKNELAKMFNNIDIFIFPSLAENFPLTTLMAMSCGVCVISAKTGGLPEQYRQGTGLLFESNNEEDLLEKITGVLTDIDKTRMLGENASVIMNSEFNSKIMIRNYNDLYNEALLLT